MKKDGGGMSQVPIQVVVLAGGRATRLGNLARATPKVLQSVAGRPFLDLMLTPLIEQGFRRFHFCLGHLADRVLQHLADSHASMEATTTVETCARGTAGALVNALDSLDDTFLIILGDTYAPLDYTALVDQLPPDADALVAVTQSIPDVMANMGLRDGRIIEYDKSNGVSNGYIDTGIAVVRRSAIERFAPAQGESDLGIVFRSLIQRGRLAGVDVASPCFDIGTPKRLGTLEDYVRVHSSC